MDDHSTKRQVQVGTTRLAGVLRRPEVPIGLVIFAHGAGSSHLSPRNNHVAEALGQRGIATLLFDLLTEEEALDRRNVFDIPLLGGRMVEAVDWVVGQPVLADLPVALFGSSTGAAAALVAAAQAPDRFASVVSRGGRPDLAGQVLPKVRAPVLMIVGGHDGPVIDLNETAAAQMTCPHEIQIVPGATHLFEEPGTLDRVIALAADWFETHFKAEGGQP
ncbi:Putative phosphoribosyl transferasec/MT0597 [Thalassovita gelatinovora]|uniref:Putative phosphoribosyl transferasec/MT0597 n=1 Tax=Thalassovita gelatinovora TaxID=53501 RepID=A0A0P1F7J4_THAGE|nr:alpha/beta family hydrolase [Thalassovita gelatinovora]QIZ82299.1 alpha/beta hydrolase [Thalassovita gelatinovora]CUH63867.1 Putative phosphoribosyl transferasec/MT0597 [Thalassovita gelatinovora]SEQ96417.1 Alpha/beta hydrolase family protein [Thalassovita gelatinovora]